MPRPVYRNDNSASCDVLSRRRPRSLAETARTLVGLLVLTALAGGCSVGALQSVEEDGSNARAAALGGAVRVPAAPEAGFSSPYYLYVPPALRSSSEGRERTLLVLPNNTGTSSDDPGATDRASGEEIGYYRRSAERTGVAVLVPAFPRPASAGHVYTHALDRDALTTDLPGLRRIDLQLLAMIDDARARLAREGVRVERRVLLHGHSAAGMFVNRFTILHPDRVKAASIGAPGGWPTLPLREYGGRPLTYPVGVADLDALVGSGLDAEGLRAVPLRFFLGADDDNDSVPYDDSYDAAERALVLDLFGPTPAARWPLAQRLLRDALPMAELATYDGVGHEVTQAMWADIFAFLSRHAATAPAFADETARPEVLVLGTHHMANPGSNVFDAEADDVLSARRQAEIAEVIRVLRAFRPTKIAVEARFSDRSTQRRYAEYLAGEVELTRNEIDQLGFRLARELGHEAVYPVDVVGDFPYPRLVKFAEATGRTAEFEAWQAAEAARSEASGAYLASHTVLETLLRTNSEEQVAEAVGSYYQLAALSEPWDWAGPDLVADWTRRNMRIYGNVVHLIDSPAERVLVIYGAGHLGWLQQAFDSNPTIELRHLADFVP